MRKALSEEEVRVALETCASEPVHIPGHIQPFACLLAIEKITWRVVHASENTNDFFSLDVKDVLGRSAQDVLPPDLMHSLRNAEMDRSSNQTATPLGDFEINGQIVTVHVSERDGMSMLEFQSAYETTSESFDALSTLTFLMSHVQSCQTQKELFDVTTRLFRHLSGFDRVMIYRFDRDYNGEVLAEARRGTMQPFTGLRFPHWDIPAQARAIMTEVPLRVIADVDADPVKLLGTADAAQNLDIRQCLSRGVAPVHIEYLRNMGTGGSMTISIVLDDRLWGIISFHHMKPRTLAPAVRDILLNVGKLFSSKLQVLEQQDRLAMIARVDAVRDNLILSTEEDGAEADGFEQFAQMVSEVLGSIGIIVNQDGVERSWGRVPEAHIVEQIRELEKEAADPLAIDNLSEVLPQSSNGLNGCAGAVVFAPEDRSVVIFRAEVAQNINWAGNPEKLVEAHDGGLRITPRGSFSTYLEETRGKSQPWTETDLYFAKRIWSLIDKVDRDTLKTRLNRQQKLMIDELNHRVRNILSLVKSVSQQAQRTSYGSMSSFSKSLEARIEALAASHDLASGSLTKAVPIWTLVDREFAPYLMRSERQLVKKGPQRNIRPETAPILSLVIHELITNAVKYGALSRESGYVEIEMEQKDGGMVIRWTEVGGPLVVTPKEFGFGTTLIREAIPFELDGTADLKFEKTGVRGSFFIPEAALARENEPIIETEEQQKEKANGAAGTCALEDLFCLVVEDNFVIAKSLSEQLLSLGFGEVETVGSAASALSIIADSRPDFAVLDINLRGNETSVPIAERLIEMHVPFMFLTGYGDSKRLPEEMKSLERLTKPATASALENAVKKILNIASERGSLTAPAKADAANSVR